MKKIDRVILAVIALALTVIALNPWVAPGYVNAQGGVAKVDIVGIAGKSIFPTTDRGTLPVQVMNSVSILK